MEEESLSGELRVASVVEVGLERRDERLLALELEQAGQAGVQKLLRVRGVREPREHAERAELVPPRGRAVLGRAHGHAQGQTGVHVGAVRVAEMLAALAEAERDARGS